MPNFADDDFRYPHGGGAICGAAWTGRYKDSSGGIYQICRDSDGFRVKRPSGAIDAWSAVETWQRVKSLNGLAGARPISSTCGFANCDDDSVFRPRPSLGSGCFAGDTLIYLANGEQAPISSLDVGTKVKSTLSYPSKLEDTEVEIINVEDHENVFELNIGDVERIVLSSKQPLLSTSGPIPSRLLFENAQLVYLKEEKIDVSNFGKIKFMGIESEPIEPLYSLVLKNRGYFFVGKNKIGSACEVIPRDVKY